jgi:hypothetical protein
MTNKLLNSIKPISLSIALSLGSFSMQNILAAEFTAPQALFPDFQGSIAPQLNFTEEESSDIYIALRVNGEGDLYFISENDGISTEALPYTSIASFTGIVDLPQYDTSFLPALQVQFFHISVKPGENLFDVDNWIGGVEGLNILNFSVGQTREIDGDWDNDGWSDDDLNKDGFHDDDDDFNGYHDDDLDKNGYHDSDEPAEEVDEPEEEPVVVTPPPAPVPAPVVAAPPPVNTTTKGKDTYDFACSACHGVNPLGNIDGILSAKIPGLTQNAINGNKGGMGALAFLTAADIQDIADYINSL